MSQATTLRERIGRGELLVGVGARDALEARLIEDLDLDSIDAVDMAARIQELTGKRVAEDDLVRMRTVGDVVDVIEKMTAASQAG